MRFSTLPGNHSAFIHAALVSPILLAIMSVGAFAQHQNFSPPPIVSPDQLQQGPYHASEFGEPVKFQLVSDELYEVSPLTNDISLMETSQRTQGRIWFSSVEASFLRPNVNLPSSSVFVQSGNRSVLSETSGAELDSFYVSPRLVLGTKKDKRAFKFRFWHLDINETEYFDSPNLPNPVTVIGVAHDQITLELSTLDFEFEKELCCKHISSSVSLGTRYAEFDSLAIATASDLLGQDMSSITAFNQQNYKGLGVITGWTGELPLRRNGWSLGWNSRASAIFGTHFQRSVASAGLGTKTAYASSAVRNSSESSSTNTSGSGSRASAIASPADDTTLLIYEGQLNLKYTQDFANVAARGFFSFGLEYQYWDLPDATTDSRVAINLPLGQSDSPSNGLGLTGFNVRAGMTY